MKYKNKNVLVYGMSVSGEWVTKLLLKLNANVFLYDDDIEMLRRKNMSNCFFVNTVNETLIQEFDAIIVSPAIEKDNQVIAWACKYNVKVFSELEFSAQFCKKLVAITGTNGKTTTVELITALLNKKYKAIACGNIGFPLSRAVLEKKSYIKVAEVSSFMLEHCQTFSPHVATVLNIEADHLIRHKTMEEYTKTKLNIFKNLKQTDYAVVNLDNNAHTPLECLTLTYSYSHMADVRVKEGSIYLHNEKVIDLNQLKIKGKHNIYNVMCAICYAYIYKVKIEDIRNALINFVPASHRIESLGQVNGISFVNDSKSTNIASTLASTNTIKGSIILLLGGSKKGLDYKKLFDKLNKRVTQVVAFGDIAQDLITANMERFKIHKSKNLSSAFDYAVSVAKQNDTILLSPASASYDEFNNYVERGKAFEQKVRNYETKTKQK